MTDPVFADSNLPSDARKPMQQPRCRFFVSEDMQDGQIIEGVRIVGPFTSSALTTLALT
jgi:hypothetical protein